MNKKKNVDEASLKWGRHPKESRKSHCVMVRFDNEEWQKFLAMYEKSGVYARAVFLKAHFFGQPFRVLVTDRTLLDYCTNLSAFHAQYRMVGNNYNQAVSKIQKYGDTGNDQDKHEPAVKQKIKHHNTSFTS